MDDKELQKALVTSAVDGVVIFVGFLLSNYLSDDWSLAVRALIGSFQPVVIFLVLKWTGISTVNKVYSMLIKTGVLSKPGK